MQNTDTIQCLPAQCNESSPASVPYRVPASAGVTAGMSPLPGGRQYCVIPYGTSVPVAVRQVSCELSYIRILAMRYTYPEGKRTAADPSKCLTLRFRLSSYKSDNSTSRDTAKCRVSVINKLTLRDIFQNVLFLKYSVCS